MIQDYLSPLPEELDQLRKSLPKPTVGGQVDWFSDFKQCDLGGYRVALIGVQEERHAVDNEGCSLGVNLVRECWYKLFKGTWDFPLLDLGNIRAGATVADTYFALKEVVSHLVGHGVIPIIIGGSQDLTFAQYRAYESLEQLVNLTVVDTNFDIGDPEYRIDSKSYMNKIILQKPNILFNYTNLAYQSFFVDPEEVQLLDRMQFDTCRLGEIKRSLEVVEPLVRDADLMSFDLASIQRHFAPGCNHSTPNGLTGEEACAIMRYAGLSDKLTSLGLYEYNPLLDQNKTTAELLAQMVWYFIEGVSLRTHDYPMGSMEQYQKFTVTMEEGPDVVFFKSNRSGRWWIEVPYSTSDPKKTRHAMIPCSYQDYLETAENELPDRWWRASRKLV